MNKENEVQVLEGRVAAILSAREIVVNLGEQSGVKKGQKFAILASEQIEIIDPQTNTMLDAINREKVRVQAYEVRPAVTICRTYRTVGGRQPGNYSQIAAELAENMSLPKLETLRIDVSSIPPPLSEENRYVKVNDRVIMVSDD